MTINYITILKYLKDIRKIVFNYPGLIIQSNNYPSDIFNC